MTRTRISLITAAAIAGALAVQGLILSIWSAVIGAAGFGVVITQNLGPNLLVEFAIALLHYAAFGLGVYLALRFFAPIGVADSWKKVIVRAIVATVSGAVLAFAFSVIISLIAAVTIGAYPFGYSLEGGVDPSRIQFGLQNAVASGLAPLIQWLPVTVLGCVFLRLWLAAHAEPAETKVRASVSA